MGRLKSVPASCLFLDPIGFRVHVGSVPFRNDFTDALAHAWCGVVGWICMPRLLPPDLLCDLVDRRRVAICLDYDGTIAPISPNPEEALPSLETRDLIVALAEFPARVLMAVASGRRTDHVKALLAIDS